MTSFCTPASLLVATSHRAQHLLLLPQRQRHTHSGCTEAQHGTRARAIAEEGAKHVGVWREWCVRTVERDITDTDPPPPSSPLLCRIGAQARLRAVRCLRTAWLEHLRVPQLPPSRCQRSPSSVPVLLLALRLPLLVLYLGCEVEADVSHVLLHLVLHHERHVGAHLQ